MNLDRNNTNPGKDGDSVPAIGEMAGALVETGAGTAEGTLVPEAPGGPTAPASSGQELNIKNILKKFKLVEKLRTKTYKNENTSQG